MSVSHDYLGQRLRALRKAKGVTGRELATMIGYSQSGISKIEKGVLRPTVELVEAICKALKVPGHEKRLLLEKTRLFLDEFNKWSIRTFDSVAESQKIVQVQESRAKLIRGYSMQVVFGLLQTREYMLSVFHALNQWDEVEIARAVTARIRRQEAVRNSDKRFQYILDE
jgi:transcriptional regulator with XRE-family HTH domain